MLSSVNTATDALLLGVVIAGLATGTALLAWCVVRAVVRRVRR